MSVLRRFTFFIELRQQCLFSWHSTFPSYIIFSFIHSFGLHTLTLGPCTKPDYASLPWVSLNFEVWTTNENWNWKDVNGNKKKKRWLKEKTITDWNCIVAVTSHHFLLTVSFCSPCYPAKWGQQKLGESSRIWDFFEYDYEKDKSKCNRNPK